MDGWVNFTEEEKIMVKEIIEEVEKEYNLKINYTMIKEINNITELDILNIPNDYKLIIGIKILEKMENTYLQKVDYRNATEVYLYDSNNYELLKKYIEEFEVSNMIKIKHERVDKIVYIESEFGYSIKNIFENALIDKNLLEIESEES